MSTIQSMPLPALTRLEGGGFARWLALILGLLLLLTVLMLWLVPWQQNIAGKGEVIVFSPMDRPQTINAQIDSRIKQWHVSEGQWVDAGELLLTLGEVKTTYLDPEQLNRLKQERQALSTQQSALNRQLAVLEKQLASQIILQEAAIPAAQLKISQASQKLAAAEQKLAAAKQAEATAGFNLSRRQELYEHGLRSKRDLELAELSMAKALADVRAAEAEVDIAKQEQAIAGFATDKVTAETTIKQQDVLVKQSSLLEKLGKLTQTIAKLDNKMASIQGRMAQRSIISPIAGQVTRMLKLGQGETVKADTPLVRVTPKTDDLAAALYIPDWHAPLLAIDDPVRLQFAGFPAIQFIGWSGMSSGTFAGKIVAIDAADNGSRYFRVLVKPDDAAINDGKEHVWPNTDLLRPGSQVQGWVLLDVVPLWFELWRQFNGFPLTVPFGDKPMEPLQPTLDPFKNDASVLKTVKQRK